MNSIKQWLERYETSELKDIVRHGCMSDCATDLIYYDDTVAFHDKYEDEIWDMLYDDASDQGITILQMLAQFNGQKNVGSVEQFKNMLCWYAVERTANEMINDLEEVE
jgi:hypothetical protein